MHKISRYQNIRYRQILVLTKGGKNGTSGSSVLLRVTIMTRLRFMWDTVRHSKKNRYQVKRNGTLEEIPRESKLGNFLFIWLRIIPHFVTFIISAFIIFFGNAMVDMFANILKISDVTIFQQVIGMLIPAILLLVVVVVTVSFLLSFFLPDEYKQFI